MQGKRKRIRSQMYFGVTMLFFIVTVLSIASFQGVLKFRKLTKNFKTRAYDLPYASEITYEVSRFTSTVWLSQKGSLAKDELRTSISLIFPKVDYEYQYQTVILALQRHEDRLKDLRLSDERLGGVDEELVIIGNVRKLLAGVDETVKSTNWNFGDIGMVVPLEDNLKQLNEEAHKLPTLLTQRMEDFSQEARSEYHTWMVLSGTMSLCALLLIALLFSRFREAIFQPLEKLLAGTRKVAGGDFEHQIELSSQDEVAELAESFNLVTRNFQEIKEDLNRQVDERTKEVVRSEQMASVGFLAAGVAHEINNPLNTIAWSAESLESRLHEMLMDRFDGSGTLDADLTEEIKKNLRRIQDEAFRCKGITDSLLDFSRLGDAQKVPTSMCELVESVVEMVRPLGKYRQRNLDFTCKQNVYAKVNAQEMKQVALNLITNALDSVPDGGSVKIILTKENNHAVLAVKDNGMGMTDEVKKHLFEPFFTRRKQGEGTGLGLSITYRIVEEHNGRIEPYSDGPNQGSTFIVRIPTVQNEQSKQRKKRAA